LGAVHPNEPLARLFVFAGSAQLQLRIFVSSST
jgi:hypothetical protein